MLGSGYESRSFYVLNQTGQWRKTYDAPQWRAEAAGRLMNVRLAQALFDDEYLTEAPFDPRQNTQRVIDALPVYKRQGVLAISVSMQGGNMDYRRSGAIGRDRSAKLGREGGSLVSAFRPDGTLKPAWLERLLLLQRALDSQGMVLDLIYFYAHQDEIFEGPEAIKAGVRNLTDWLIEHQCRNVIIEIANECDASAFDHDHYITEHIGDLIELARSRFAARHAPFTLPISASTLGGPKKQLIFPALKEHADLTIVHGNGSSPETKQRQITALMNDASVPGPVYMNEDDNGRETTPEILNIELAGCDQVFKAGASWGYMPWVQAQVWPFRFFAPSGNSQDSMYFRDVLDHIRTLVQRP